MAGEGIAVLARRADRNLIELFPPLAELGKVTPSAFLIFLLRFS